MASAAQVRANRLNAQKSTGPRTPEGKAVVAQNAVKHGLLGQQVVVRGEDPGEFELYRDQMLEDLGPVGSLEDLLAERVAHLGWRLRRAERFERAAYTTLETDYAARKASTPPALRRPQDEAEVDEETALARVVVEDFGRGKLLDRLLGYERRIENSLYRTVNELRKQRLLRELQVAEDVSREISSLKCEVSSKQSQLPGPTEASGSEYRLQAGEDRAAAQDRAHVEGRTIQTRVNAELRTAPETPCGVTTNGAEGDDEVRQTNPEEVTGDKCQVTSAEAPEPSDSELPTADASCGTKPICVGGSEERGLGAETWEVGRGRPSYEEASDDATTNTNAASCQTKPIGDGEDPSGAVPFAQAGASPGAPSASF